ncbi:MAG: hypothetical protein J1F07_09140 [Muribaculaceae bacterium]|nr:hypothetical protein [Muribaculaceae bacterium]
MKKLFTSIAAAICMAVMSLSASAATYMPQPSIEPANGTTLEQYMGYFTLVWTGVTLDLPNTDKGVRNPLPLNMLHVYVNDVEQNNSLYFSADDFYASKMETSNEQDGGSDIGTIWAIRIWPNAIIMGDKLNANKDWVGNIRIVLDEGIVKTTAGAISPEIVINYKHYETNGNITWDPAMPNVSNDQIPYAPIRQGGTIYASWAGGGQLALGPNKNGIYTEISGEDSSSRTNLGNNISITSDNRLQINLPESIGPGFYLLTMGEGVVTIGGSDVFNAMTYYYIEIVEAGGMPKAESYPRNNYLDSWLYDHASITWGGNALRLANGSGISLTCDGGPTGFTLSSNVVYLPVDEEGNSQPDTGDGNTRADDGAPNTLVVSWGEPIFTEGVYVLTIPTGTVEINIDGEWVPNNEVSFTYNVFNVETTDIKPTIDVKDGVVSIDWNKNAIEFAQENLDLQITYVGGSTTVVRQGSPALEIVDGNTLTVDFNKLNLESGNYTFFLNAKEILIHVGSGLAYNDSIEFELNYSSEAGVSAIGDNDAEVVYYDLQGRKVANPDKGIFIKVAGGKAVKVVK